MSIDLLPRLVAFSRTGSVAPPGESTSGRTRGAKAWRALRRLWSVGAVLLVLGATWYTWPASRGGRATIVFVSGNSMEPTYSTDDVVVARRQDSYRVGDVIVYRIGQGDAGAGHLVIHRITAGDGNRGWTTQGDNRAYADAWHPTSAQVIGRAAHSAGIGRQLLTAFALLVTPWVWALAATVVAFKIAWGYLGEADSGRAG